MCNKMASNFPTVHVTGFGNILNQITCSHVLIASFNVIYSHDFLNSREHLSFKKTFTIYRKTWSSLNTSSALQNIAYRSYSLPENERKLFRYSLYVRSFVICTIILSSHHKFFWDTKAKYVTYQPIYAIFADQGASLCPGIKTLPTFYIELIRPKFKRITASQILSLQIASMNFNNFFAVLNCNLISSTIPDIFEIVHASTSYFCVYCIPDPALIELLPISSSNLLDISSFRELVLKIGSPKHWIFKPVNYDIDIIALPDYKNGKRLFHLLKGPMDLFPMLVADMVIYDSKKNHTLHIKPINQHTTNMTLTMSPQLIGERYRQYLYHWEHVEKTFKFVFTSFEGINFLTCYSKQFINIKFYMKPFQGNLWIGLLVMVVVLTTFAYRMFVRKVITKRHSFNPLFYMLSGLLENAPSLPSCIEKHGFVKLVTGSWLILVVVTANGYKGLITNYVVAPLSRHTELETFDDLLSDKFGGRFYADLNTECLEVWQASVNQSVVQPMKQLDLACSKINGRYCTCTTVQSLVVRTVTEMLIWPQHFENLRNRQEIFEELYFVSNGSRYNTAPNQQAFGGSYNAAMESEIVKCEKEQVLLGTSSVVQKELQYLSKVYAGKQFFIGKEPIQNHDISWQFTNPKGSIVPTVFDRFVESGIFHQLKGFYEGQQFSGNRIHFSRGNTDWRKAEPVKLSSNFQTLFITWGCGLIVACCYLLMENWYILGMLILPLYKLIRNNIVNPASLVRAIISKARRGNRKRVFKSNTTRKFSA